MLLKVIKQTIMTTVYGVTPFGARAQIRRQLNYLEDFPAEQVSGAALYLCDKTMYCLRQMFHSARDIQVSRSVTPQSPPRVPAKTSGILAQVQDWFVLAAYLMSLLQDWFVLAAYLISRRNESVSWRTPLGFPVVSRSPAPLRRSRQPS